jgi:hypothetical protein
MIWQVGLAAFDLRSASLHLSQYIETSSSYQNTKTLLHFYDPIVIIVPPNKSASSSTSTVTELVDRYYGSVKKVMWPCLFVFTSLHMVAFFSAKLLCMMSVCEVHFIWSPFVCRQCCPVVVLMTQRFYHILFVFQLITRYRML